MRKCKTEKLMGVITVHDSDHILESHQGHDIVVNSKDELTKDRIMQLLAQGYCTERNSNKVVDPDLIDDMAKILFDDINRREIS